MTQASRALCALLVISIPVCQAADPDLRKTLNDEHAFGADFWIYNDIGEAMAAGRKQNKPVFVTFRCVPCEACEGFDAEVAKGSERIARLARTRFIPVRQVEMEGVDLSIFQFDHDLNWAAMFVNGDGTVYARYGTQSSDGPDAYNSIAGLEKTMNRVLRLHKDYPNNKAQLAGKKPRRRSFKTAMDMPGLRDKDKLRGATTRKNCIHCHMIHDAEHFAAQDNGTFDYEMLWRYPLPDNIGLTINAVDGTKIDAVARGSAAAKAGLKAGENVTHINGQAITSIADMQWALHQVPNADDVSITVRGSRNGETDLTLNKDWKVTDISWRGSMWSVSPRMRVWTPELPVAKRKKLGLPASQKPLEVRWINRRAPGGRAAFESGLREGDVVVALDGKPIKLSPTAFHAHIKLNYKIGDKLPLTILRGGKRRELAVDLVE